MTIFNANQMQGFTLDLSDREIYNDIRAECDITEILELRPDATPEFFEQFQVQGGAYGIGVGETKDIVVDAPSDHSEIAWLSITSHSSSPVTQFGWTQEECEVLGGEWRVIGSGPSMCLLPPNLGRARLRIIKRGETSCTVSVENRSDYAIGIVFFVAYLAVTSARRFLKLRSRDTTSEKKYGRRVMDKPWPLGIHPVTMQSLIDGDCVKYSEPVCMASMTLEGKDDTNTNAILLLRMDEKHQFIHPRLEMDEEFFINNINIDYKRERSRLLIGTFDLEQVRAMEELTFFTLDVSRLDSAHVLA